MSPATRPELSVIVPVFRCADCLEALHARLRAVLRRACDGHEVLYVDDASDDDAARVLDRIAATDDSVRLLRHDHNRGQHAAIATGARAARATHVAVLDADLQDPPELLEQLLPLARAGHPVVAGDPEHVERGWRRWASRAFTRLLGGLLGHRLPRRRGVYSVVSREAVAQLLASPHGGQVWLLGLEALGYPVVSVPYTKGLRHAGRSAYRPVALIRLAWAGLRAGRAIRKGVTP